MTTRKESAERLIRRLDLREANCAVVGLGFVGCTTVHALLAAGLRVYGCDRDPKVVEETRARIEGMFPEHKLMWSVGTDPEKVGLADVVIVAVRAHVDNSDCELEPIRSVAEVLRKAPQRERLVLIESTVPAGVTRLFAFVWMRSSLTTPVFVAHAPERLSAGESWRDLCRHPRLVGALDSLSARVAHRFLSIYLDHIVPVSAPEVSEISKLLENAFASVSIALIADVGKLSTALGITATEVCHAAATKLGGYHAFYPGPGIGGHCLPSDLEILRITLQSNRQSTALLDAAKQSISDMPSQVVRRVATLLLKAGYALRGMRVLLVGVGFKPGSADTSNTPARLVTRLLRSEGAILAYCDSLVPSFEVDGESVKRIEVDNLSAASFAATIILAGDACLTGAQLKETATIILDAGGAQMLAGKPIDCESL